jgi:pimeloyl-ACP methyl ester carboxylesterase
MARRIGQCAGRGRERSREHVVWVERQIRDHRSVADLAVSGPDAGEWKSSAELLTESYQVFAVDQRGHGPSEFPADVFRDAYTEDAVATIQQIDSGPVTLIGQSRVTVTAMFTAVRYPEMMSAVGPGVDPADVGRR